MILIQYICLSINNNFRENDNVIARMNLELDEAKLDRGRSLEDSHESVVQVLNETVISGKVGALTLDPQYLKVEPIQSKYYHFCFSLLLLVFQLYLEKVAC